MGASRKRWDVGLVGLVVVVLAVFAFLSFRPFHAEPQRDVFTSTPGAGSSLRGTSTVIADGTQLRPTHPPSANALATLPPVPALNQTLVDDGRKLYDARCASCHGANLQGQPDWKKKLPNGQFPAPPQDDTGHTWHHPDAVIYRIIFEGGNGDRNAVETGMPAFRDQLSGRDAVAIVSYLKSTWSQDNREYQWEMTIQGH